MTRPRRRFEGVGPALANPKQPSIRPVPYSAGTGRFGMCSLVSCGLTIRCPPLCEQVITFDARVAVLVWRRPLFLNPRPKADRLQALRVSDAVRRQKVFDARTAGIVG